MNESYPFEERLVSYLYETFPDAQDIPNEQMLSTVLNLLEKASHYGFEAEDDQAVYIVTAYLLGVDFDNEFPAAAHILTDPAFSAAEKAEQLQTWTQELLKTLEEEQATTTILPPQEPIPHAATIDTYLEMQEDSAPFREKAEWVVQLLISGNITGFKENFSPNFLRQLGAAEVEKVCTTIFLPFFSGAEKLSNSATVTMTTDAFGSTGYAFYLSFINQHEEKHFVIYMVSEDNRIVVANLLPNKTYQDMH
ncbi:hypothetical protein GXP67_33390 [Rhodocytophaga rosea]|uniref:Uncharacterized protein n=1 Tax=Rhodocytophaga rosea TaxID=2704465 RepID=A0A6C0GSR5_9BACT|nr:hypothetical protein [Rhodocytophaga rosea]QHT71201.1 hypothetical protein GXP67_33390 [Rhodocytophaga rosea]